VGLYTEALRRDSANPYRWSIWVKLFSPPGIGTGTLLLPPCTGAEPPGSQVWLRDANFHFELDEPQDALRSAAHVLKTVPDYDSVLFGYFDRLIDSPSAVLAQIGDDRRATRSYLQHLVGTGNMDGARAAWTTHW